MSQMIRLAAVPLLVAALAFMLKELGFGGARLFAGVGAVTVLGLAIGGIGEVMGKLLPILENGAADEAFSVSVKILGVGYVFGTVSDLCRDIGESGVASAALTLGRVEILLLICPYIVKILQLVGGMMT